MSNSIVPLWKRLPLSHAAPSRRKSALRPRYGSTRHSEAWMSQAEESNTPCARILATGSSVSSAAVARRRLMWVAMLDGSRAAAAWIERFGHSLRWLHEYVAGTASGGRYLIRSAKWLGR